MRLSKKKFWALFLLLLGGALGLLFVNRAAVLVGIGKVLLVQEEIKQPGDLIVPLRGGKGYERLLEAFELYKAGKGDKICIMKSLGDLRVDKLAKSRKAPVVVIPAKAGIQGNQVVMDSRFRGSDGLGDFLRIHQGLRS